MLCQAQGVLEYLPTMSITIPDYANTAFQYPTVDKIVGQPKFGSLKTIKQHFDANVQTVGDVANFGYLGLVLTPQEFVQVHNRVTSAI